MILPRIEAEAGAASTKSARSASMRVRRISEITLASHPSVS